MQTINPKHIAAFSQCPYKAYLLLNSSDEFEQSEYENIDDFKFIKSLKVIKPPV